MFVRNHDFGDASPGDDNDIIPINRANNFSESDYDLDTIDVKAFPFVQPRKESDREQTEIKKDILKDYFVALIVKRIDEGHYLVLRQDGGMLEAYTKGDTRKGYQEFERGDMVVILGGVLLDQWWLVGPYKNTELSSATLQNDVKIEFTGPTLLQMTLKDNSLTGDYLQINQSRF